MCMIDYVLYVCCVLLCYVVYVCYAMLCYIMPCYAMLCMQECMYVCRQVGRQVCVALDNQLRLDAADADYDQAIMSEKLRAAKERSEAERDEARYRNANAFFGENFNDI